MLIADAAAFFNAFLMALYFISEKSIFTAYY